MKNSTNIHSTPPRPEGMINPVEAPIAAAVVQEMPLGILFQEQKAPLYYWLINRFPSLAEEIWVELFGGEDAPQAQECRIIQMQA